MADVSWYVTGLAHGVIALAFYVMFLERERRRRNAAARWVETPFVGGPYDGGTSLPCSPDVRTLRVAMSDGSKRVHVYQRAAADEPLRFSETTREEP